LRLASHRASSWSSALQSLSVVEQASKYIIVIAGLDPAIHRARARGRKNIGAQTHARWVAASRAAMTEFVYRIRSNVTKL
jgi:hypothetical protein